MDLSFVQRKGLRYFIQRSFLLSCIFLLVACASTPNQTGNATVVAEPENVIVEVVEEQSAPESLPLNAELVYYILMAEIAGQRGEIGVAADLYNKAADSIDSPALAGRSTQIANFTRNQKRIMRALERWIEIDPTDADVYIMQAPFLMLTGDYDGVVKAVDTALELAPTESQRFLTQIADNLSELTQADQGLSVLQRLKLYQNNDPEALFAYARLAAFLKHYDSALTHVELVLKQQQKREDALILKAETLQRLDRGDSAVATLKQIAQQKTASEELQFSYAKLLGENGKLAQSRTVFEQLNQAHPENEEVLFALGLLALEEKDGTVAKSYFSQLISLGDHGKQAAYFMGLSEQLNNNIESAMIWFASVPADSPRFQAAQTRYVDLLADNDQLDKARLHLKLLRKEHPEQSVQYFAFEATFLRDRGQNQAAFGLYNEALHAHPNHIELLYGRAMVAESLNRLSVLEADLKQILAQEPNNASALNALGYTLTDRTNRHQEALNYIEQALAISPDDPFYLDSLGWVHYRLGNLDKAEHYLKQAVAAQDDPEFLAHLGEVLWQKNKQEEAKRVWKQAIKQSPSNKLLTETMRRFGQ